MAYVHRRVKAGQCVEHKKMQSFRVHTKGVKRSPNHGATSEKQAKINERVTEERLRWKINANYGHRDLHAVLHYYDKGTSFTQLVEDLKLFLKRLRRICKKRGIRPRYIAVLETKRMTNPHIHLIVNRMDPEIIAEAWEGVPKGEGNVSFKPMDRRGNHYKLANYLMKESRATMERYKEAGIRGKRFWCSQGMAEPEITYEVVAASSWRKEPKASKGAVLYKFDDGATCKSGWHEISGYPYQEYFEVFNE
uniref:Rep protein n=1 Tax=Dulem virus 34 TaxID=3145752 RepID=A0AAU8B822_9CAUD